MTIHMIRPKHLPSFLICAFLLVSSAIADSSASQPTSQSSASQPGSRFKTYAILRDLPYVPGADPAQTLDLYLPEHSTGSPLPLIVWVHGGGWLGGSKGNPPAAAFLSQGYAVASVEYRFSKKALFPAQIQDCQAAIRWLRANSAKYHLDPDHFGAWGGSAGGHLVAMLGVAGGQKAFAPIGGNEDQSDKVQCVVDFYGPADFATVVEQAQADKSVKNAINFNSPADPFSSLIGGPLGQNAEKALAASPVHYVSKQSAPILIVHGTADILVPYAQSVELFDALRKAGADATLQKLPNAGHGGPAFGCPPMKQLIKAFFDKHLKGIDAKIEPLPESEVTMPAK